VVLKGRKVFPKAFNGKSWLRAWLVIVLPLFALGVAAVPAEKPRLGPITVVEVVLPGRAALDELIGEGYNISNVRGDIVTIYATDQELNLLRKAGYDYQITEAKDTATKDLGDYHSYASLTADLQAYAAAHPAICRLYSLGQSVQGRELWALLITDYPHDEEDEPEFKYIGAIHGDESLSTEMCLYFIDLLLTKYDANSPRIVNLIDNTAIWIMPLMNPDGLENNSRYNARGYDLNRSFPAYPHDFTGTIFDGKPLGDIGREPEVAHIMRWTARNSFVLGGEFHTGALVMNYPYDDDGLGSVDSPTPDDLLFEEVSRWYSVHNPPMWNSPLFFQGITNGAAWYSITGGMEDWNYRYVSCNDVIIEISDNKKPHPSQIPAYWADNRESMLSYLEAVHIGVRGVVTDYATGEPLWARLTVARNAHPVFTDPNVGDYHRMLLPGTYTLTFSIPGYLSQTVSDVTVIDGPATRIDIELVLDADFNGDGNINFKDFALFAADWENTVCPYCPGDYTGDGHVGIRDLSRLLAYWLRDAE